MKKLVDENTVVEPGKFYLVKCAIWTNDHKTYLIPVIGEIHNDKQFGFPYKHIHIDGRFCGQKERLLCSMDSEGKTNMVLTYVPINEYSVRGFENRIRMCKRITTGIKPPGKYRMDFMGEIIASPFHEWVDGMIGKSCKGKKCPHLGTTMFEENGILLCPLHNLISDEKHKKIVGVKY